MFDEQLVQRIVSRRGDPVVTSLYLDVDGRHYPTRGDYQVQAKELFQTARRRAAGLGPAAVAAVDADIDRFADWLDAPLDRTATRGLALFSCATDGWFAAVPLPLPVRPQVRVSPSPDVGPLLVMLDESHRCLVVLVDRRQARLVRVELGRTIERPGLLDQPERSVDTEVEVGGWDRRRDEEARRHFRAAAGLVLREVGRWNPEHVILGGPVEDVASLRSFLDRRVTERIAGSISASITASPSHLGEAVSDILRVTEAQRQLRLVEELFARAPQGRRAVLGLPAVMQALSAHRVGTLIIARDFRPTGALCPACGHVGPAACQCPECGTPSVVADDLIDLAIDEAYAQGATVEMCEAPELDDNGGIGALEWY